MNPIKTKALGNVVEEDDPLLPRMDIPFFAHCGGIRIHPWKLAY